MEKRKTNRQYAVRGTNTIQDLAPWLVDWLVDPQDSTRYTPDSHVRIQAKCPDCGYKKSIILSNLHRRRGFKCPICSDGKSFPQRFLTNLFLMYDIDFIPQLSKKHFNWIGEKRYDFYLPKFNSIVQAHGLHHYVEMKDFNISGEKQQKIDDEKKQLALQNGIQQYIVVDFSSDEIANIKQKVIQSGLLDLLGLYPENIQWEQIYRKAAQSIIKKVCDYYEQTKATHDTIGKLFGINRVTVGRYLRKGSKLGWTTFVIGQRVGIPRYDWIYGAYDSNNVLICRAQSMRKLRNKLQIRGITLSESSIYSVVCGKVDNFHGLIFRNI